MWKIIKNLNFNPENPNDEPEFYVCNGMICFPAYTPEEAEELCERLNRAARPILRANLNLPSEPEPEPETSETNPFDPI